MKKYGFLYIVFLLLTACQSVNDKKLEYALELAGNNRKELEHVLEHYRDDSLKLEAAKFLIRNMPGHGSYTGKAIENYYAEAAPILLSDSPRAVKERMMNELYQKYPPASIKQVQDVEIITADYLIRNIDRAVDDWQNGPFAKQVSFDDFCEYLLPYKCADYQTLDNWRDSLRIVAEGVYEDYPHSRIRQNSAYWAAAAVNDSLGRLNKVHLSDAMQCYSLFRLPFWTKIPSGRCGVYSVVSLGVLRSKGIPVVNDFILQWPTKDGDHSWVTLLTDTRNKGFLEGNEGGVMGFMRPGECKGKVYRRTYAPDEGLVRLNAEARYVPEKLRSVFMKDVTAEYVEPVDATTFPLREAEQEDEKYAYLAVYGNKDWVPICYSRIEGKDIVFEDLEREAVYMPMYYTSYGMEPLNYPFLLTHKKELRYLKPDKEHTRSVTLYRKYPLMRRAFEKGQCMKGSMIQASDNPDFSDAVTLYNFRKFSLSGHVFPGDSVCYRYWRYICPAPYNCYIAELGFFDGQNQKMEGKIIGTGQYYGDDKRFCREAAFDGDPFTFYISDLLCNGWIGMDFGKPVHVEKIHYLARSDDNNIRIGDLYELYYWDMKGWVSLGQQEATDLILTFDNVPENALLILRDHTRGKDERIFIYEDDKQIWY